MAAKAIPAAPKKLKIAAAWVAWQFNLLINGTTIKVAMSPASEIAKSNAFCQSLAS